jgi:AraC-like DNA-binding protein
LDFITQFHQSVSGRKMINMKAEPDILIPNIYTCQSTIQTNLLKLLAGGTCPIDYPFSFSFSPFTGFLFLYTLSGSGKLNCEHFSAIMTEQTGILFDCTHSFTLQTAVLPWKFKLFFINGNDWDSYHALSPYPIKPFSIPVHSAFHQNLSKLSGIPNQYSDYDAIIMHKALTDILCDLYLANIPTPTPSSSIPEYLVEMKNQFDYHYQMKFSLSSLENTLKINKYRLCREFSKFYGMPPLQYLNQKRIEIAKEMLLTTDYNIHEISSYIGYENTNHFINLFKKSTNLTPSAFKQTVLVEQSALHSPVQ